MVQVQAVPQTQQQSRRNRPTLCVRLTFIISALCSADYILNCNRSLDTMSLTVSQSLGCHVSMQRMLLQDAAQWAAVQSLPDLLTLETSLNSRMPLAEEASNARRWVLFMTNSAMNLRMGVDTAGSSDQASRHARMVGKCAGYSQSNTSPALVETIGEGAETSSKRNTHES